MALYRFEAKSSKNGSGKKHSDYLNREGKYKDWDMKEMLKQQCFSKNILSPKSFNSENNTAYPKERYLYRNVCGSIIEKDNQLKISDDASEDTIQLAIVLAVKKFGNSLNITGTDTFKAMVVKATVDINYNINFSDMEVNNNIHKLREQEINNRDEFNRQSRRDSDAGPSISFDNIKQISKNEEIFTSKREDSLQIMSIRNMDGNNEFSGMLLYGNETDSMVNQEKLTYNPLRRNVYTSKIKHIEKLADEIIRGKRKSSSKGASHADYINREDVFAVKGGCIYKNHRLPKWANNSPRNFFAAADSYEPKNGVPYLEYVLSLQNELTLEQNLEIVNTFLKRCELLNDKYYAFAIHDKEAALDKTQRQIHCHLMFSTRCIDQIEKVSERKPEVFFSRYRPQNPEKGGCKKDRRFSYDNGRGNISALKKMRKLWADITNATFEKYGIDVKLSHKSLEAQREDALKEKDFVKAEILNRAPERYLGPQHCQNPNDSAVINIQKARNENKKRIEAIKVKEISQNIIKEQETEIKNISTLKSADDLLKYFDKINIQSNSIDIKKLKDSIISLTNQLKEKSCKVIPYKTALEKSRLALMNSLEFNAYNELKRINIETVKLKNELSFLQKNNANILRQDEISTILKQYANVKTNLRETVQKANKRLLLPNNKSRITKQVNKILKENQPARDEVVQLTSKMDTLFFKLRNIVMEELSQNQNEKTSTAKQTYTAIDIKDILVNMEHELRRTIQSREMDLNILYKKIISEERAKVMALDIITNKDFKVFRELSAQLKRDKITMEKITNNLKELKFNITGMKQSDENYLKLNIAYKNNLEKYNALSKTISSNEKEIKLLHAKITTLINQPSVKAKINQIIAGILSKNLSIKNDYKIMSQNVNNMKSQLNRISTLKTNVVKQIKNDYGKNISYMVKPKSGNIQIHGGVENTNIDINRKNANIIAEAISGNITAGNAVIRIDDDNYDEFADYISQNQADKQAKENEQARNL